MRQRTEIFTSMILLATVLHQGRKKIDYKRAFFKVSEFYRLKFDTLSNCYCCMQY